MFALFREEAGADVDLVPEQGIDVVILGPVHSMQVDDNIVNLDVTLSAAACPLTDVIEDQTRQVLTWGHRGRGRCHVT